MAQRDGQAATGGETQASRADTERELSALVREAAHLRRELAAATDRGSRNAQALLAVETRLALAQARVVELDARNNEREAELAQLRQRVQRADRVARAMTASLSWRVTLPLRALKRRV